eukprot:scaffold43711_cov19-Tisochrysis_lutea.AAC.1
MVEGFPLSAEEKAYAAEAPSLIAMLLCKRDKKASTTLVLEEHGSCRCRKQPQYPIFGCRNPTIGAYTATPDPDPRTL